MYRLLLIVLLFHAPSCDASEASNPRTVEAIEVVYVDSTRVTPAIGNVPEKNERRLRVRAWIPRGGSFTGPTPLLFMSHGWGGSIDLFDSFANTLAMQGISVAALEDPCTNRHFEGGHEAGLVDYAEQPIDYLFVLDRLIDSVSDPNHPLYGTFSTDHIVGLGHSLGGATLIRASRQACCADGRLKATIFLSPATFVNEVLLDEPLILEEGPPTLIAHGANDGVIGLEESEALLTAINQPAHLVVLAGANHESPIESESETVSPDQKVFESMVAAFITDYVRGSANTFAEELERQLASGAISIPGIN